MHLILSKWRSASSQRLRTVRDRVSQAYDNANQLKEIALQHADHFQNRANTATMAMRPNFIGSCRGKQEVGVVDGRRCNASLSGYREPA